ncbi:MAG TPA: SGNH/GDSL hydrolase family protein [Streptosporangiaceae bacterium]|jgi:lysophospholipase L1-like esterase
MRNAAIFAVIALCLAIAGAVTAVVLTSGQGRRAARGSHVTARHHPAGGDPAGLEAPAGQPASPRYYLSLGDSLALGIQPRRRGAETATSEGYPDQLLGVLRRTAPGLRLAKLGCSGETTSTMIRGGICAYPAGSQLGQAEAFLRAHPGQVPLITLDIGANDPNTCILGTTAGGLGSCLTAHFRSTLVNLAAILRQLRAAAGRQTTIVGMNYYVPELAGWFDGQNGKLIAVISERLVASYNRMLGRVYSKYGVRVANVFRAFHSADFTDKVTLPRLGSVPRNVATVCEWTWTCSPAPLGPNEHANSTGYGIIALEFLLAYQR